MNRSPNYPKCSLVSNREAVDPFNRYGVCHITYNRDTWVKLAQAPGDYADDEAKLLCPQGADTWVAWVPNYGELLLDRSQFYC